MDGEMEAPTSVEELYLARGDDVSEARPLLTGDIIEGLDIPGVDQVGDAIILQHPCSMRKDGVNLANRLLAARVTPHQEIPLQEWRNGHFARMPLPELHGEGHHAAASFEDIGLVRAEAVEGGKRLSSLSRKGINLLQQRFIFYLTRFAVPTHRLDAAAAAVLEEADLLEEWTSAAMARGDATADAIREFHEWIRSDVGEGDTRQRRLAEPQSLSAVRRELRRELEQRNTH